MPKKTAPVAIPNDAFVEIASPEISFVVGHIWAVADSETHHFVNTAMQSCMCGISECPQVARALAERVRLTTHFACREQDIPDSDLIFLAAIQHAVDTVVKAA